MKMITFCGYFFHLKLVKALVHAGADIHAMNKNGETAVDIARDCPKVLQVILVFSINTSFMNSNAIHVTIMNCRPCVSDQRHRSRHYGSPIIVYAVAVGEEE